MPHSFPPALARALLFVVSIAVCPALGAEPCQDYTAQRRPFFGDTHIHTSYSQDANWRMGSSQTTPADAYRFARGERISLPPYDGAGKSVRSLKIQRPLDFAVVTDHAENMNVVRICNDPESPDYNHWMCGKNQILGAIAELASDVVPGIDILCQEDTTECTAATHSVWQDTIEAAQQHNQNCDFTTFIGYEWSATQGGANLHRNVVFRSEQVPSAPISALSAEHVEDLWQSLDQQCRDADIDCEAITIPHNMNLSQGKMFTALMGNGEPMDSAVAEQRARYERLAEIIQHKGDSECYYSQSFDADELCNFEKLPYSSFLQKYVSALRELYPVSHDGTK